MARNSFYIVLITAPRGRRAHGLAQGLVRERLAACVNVMPTVVSHYRWQNKLRRDAECLLIAKTSRSKLAALKRWVCAHHPYAVPELIAVAIKDGSRAYLRWLTEQL